MAEQCETMGERDKSEFIWNKPEWKDRWQFYLMRGANNFPNKSVSMGFQWGTNY